jgi:hypothetical protein
MTTFRGSFTPPAMGRIHAPIPIVGEGSLSVLPDGLEAQGRRARQGAGCLIAAAVVGSIVAAAVVAVALESTLGASHAVLARVIAGVVMVGIIAPALRRRRTTGAEPAWTFRVPLAAIRSVQPDIDQPGAVVIVLKGSDPNGALHFSPGPDASPTDVLASVRALSSAR